MIVLPDKSFILEEGEKYPLICPKCDHPRKSSGIHPKEIRCTSCGETFPREEWMRLSIKRVLIP